MKHTMTFAVFAAAALVAGCATFKPTMKELFVDDKGNVMTVEYGDRSRKYEYEMVSPMNGVVVKSTATKMVRVTTPEPENEVLDFYLCQNVSPKGTMYSTRNEKWKFLTIGTASQLYLWSPDENDYLLVFEGELFVVPQGGTGK